VRIATYSIHCSTAEHFTEDCQHHVVKSGQICIFMTAVLHFWRLILALCMYIGRAVCEVTSQHWQMDIIQYILLQVKVKQSRNRPGVAHRFPGGWGS